MYPLKVAILAHHAKSAFSTVWRQNMSAPVMLCEGRCTLPLLFVAARVRKVQLSRLSSQVAVTTAINNTFPAPILNQGSKPVDQSHAIGRDAI